MAGTCGNGFDEFLPLRVCVSSIPVRRRDELYGSLMLHCCLGVRCFSTPGGRKMCDASDRCASWNVFPLLRDGPSSHVRMMAGEAVCLCERVEVCSSRGMCPVGGYVCAVRVARECKSERSISLVLGICFEQRLLVGGVHELSWLRGVTK